MAPSPFPIAPSSRIVPEEAAAPADEDPDQAADDAPSAGMGRSPFLALDFVSRMKRKHSDEDVRHAGFKLERNRSADAMPFNMYQTFRSFRKSSLGRPLQIVSVEKEDYQVVSNFVSQMPIRAMRGLMKLRDQLANKIDEEEDVSVLVGDEETRSWSRPRMTRTLPMIDAISCIVMSPDNELIAIGSTKGITVVYSALEGTICAAFDLSVDQAAAEYDAAEASDASLDSIATLCFVGLRRVAAGTLGGKILLYQIEPRPQGSGGSLTYEREEVCARVRYAATHAPPRSPSHRRQTAPSLRRPLTCMGMLRLPCARALSRSLRCPCSEASPSRASPWPLTLLRTTPKAALPTSLPSQRPPCAIPAAAGVRHICMHAAAANPGSRTCGAPVFRRHICMHGCSHMPTHAARRTPHAARRTPHAACTHARTHARARTCMHTHACIQGWRDSGCQWGGGTRRGGLARRGRVLLPGGGGQE